MGTRAEVGVDRIGLFGGTFDPPHLGHTAVAADVADALGLDRVLWIPAGAPPHKDPDQPSPSRHRLEMVRAAVRADPRFEASPIEIERPGPSYTVDTVRAIRERYPRAELFVIVGVDQYRALDDWRDPREIVKEARFAVMNREGASPDRYRPRVLDGMERGPLASGSLPPVVFVPVRRVDLSSSAIRERVRVGLTVAGLVDREVERILERESLYRG